MLRLLGVSPSLRNEFRNCYAIKICFAYFKRVMGIEPTYLAWKASVLPLNYTRKSMCENRLVPRAGIEPATRGFSVLCSTD